MLIFKVLTPAEHDDLRRLREFPGSPADVADGFVHLSTSAQLPGTLAKHFAGHDRLWLVAIEADALGDRLEWEPARGGDLFPHLYRNLWVSDVVSAELIERADDGAFRLPDKAA